MEYFWTIFGKATWWVYVICVYFLIAGIMSTKSRTISIKRVFTLPTIAVLWSFYGLYQKLLLYTTPSWILVWVVSLVIGAWIGNKWIHSWHFHIDRRKHKITIPHNYSTLVLSLLFIGMKFSWGYYYATHTEVISGMYIANTIMSGLLAGLFVGRAMLFLKRYRNYKAA